MYSYGEKIFILISRSKRAENTALGISHTDHVALSNPQKLALTSLTSGSRSVGIVRSWTQATQFYILIKAFSPTLSTCYKRQPECQVKYEYIVNSWKQSPS
jgi:hypothetical protein